MNLYASTYMHLYTCTYVALELQYSVRGNNVYKLGHLKKDKLIREGHLPDSLAVSMDLYNNSKQYLLENGYSI